MSVPSATVPSRPIRPLDLQAYLRRVRHAGPLIADGRTLRALHRAHVLHIPFENLDIVLHGGVSLALPDVAGKLVRRHRGGYCYEHAILFASVLETLELPCAFVAARIRMGSARSRPRTHALLWVQVEGEDWVADVGFGGGGPLEPVPLRDGVEQRQGGWTFRLEREDRVTWRLRSLRGGRWLDLYAFDLLPQTLEDLEVMNHYMATHPRSPFAHTLRVQRCHTDRRFAMDGLMLTVEDSGGAKRTQSVQPAHVPRTLREVFGISLPGQVAESLKALAAARRCPPRAR